MTSPRPVRSMIGGVDSVSMSLPDAASGQLLFSVAPSSWHPFLQLARLDRPIGWWLLVLPCWWSSALASLAAHRPLAIGHLILFVVGAIAMRGAGSTYNDIVDRDVDALVERTRHRPIASGRVGVEAAWVFLVAQALIGLAVVLCLNWFTIGLGLGSLAVVAVYPFMKRITSWPQLVLGLAFAWGALVGWSALLGSLTAAPFWLYAAAVAWTIGYDTIYAIQDARDDPAAGIKSTARLFAGRIREALGVFYLSAVVFVEIAIIASGSGNLVAAQCGVAGFALHLTYQLRRVDPDDPARALALFRSNRDAGLILFAGLAIATVLR